MNITAFKTNVGRLVRAMPLRLMTFIAAVLVFLTVSNVALSYGPSRATYTIEHPADHITFDSITDNPNYGDERNFLLIKDAADTNGNWSNELNVEDGKEYIMRLYVHNNAAANLNLVAENTHLKVNIPTDTANSIQIDGFIAADNATPQEVWDDVVLKSDKKFNLAYVNGSAHYYNNANPNTGFNLADSLVTSAGAKIGYTTMDGKVPGCFQYSGVATFRVKVQGETTPNFNVTKQVRLNGTTEWKKSITAQPGQKVEYRLGYENTGETRQDDVTVKDQLPAGVTYDQGTTYLKNANNPNGDGIKVSDNVVQGGINIGNYETESNAFVKLTATLPTEDKLENCGANTLRNKVTVDTDNGAKSDTADVIVNRTCAPNECKPGIPMGDSRCACQPANPKGGDQGTCALPVTGPAEIVAGLVAVAAITIGVVYYFRSRQELKTTLHGLHR